LGNLGRAAFDGRSIRVLTFSPKGAHWGRYWNTYKVWEVEGFGYDPGVTHWMDIFAPE